MKRTIFLLMAVLLIVTFMPAAAAGPDVKLSGPHWELHLIGTPKGINGDDSSGHAIMVPLKNATGPNSIVCEADEVVYEPDPALTFTDQEPAGAKLYWKLGPTFEILDRDATDKDGATIQIPWTADGSDVMAVTVWVRVHGKPGTCMDIDAWAFDGEYYFLAGSIDLNRKTGRATWTNVDDLFDVVYCDEITDGVCTGNVTQDLSVFSDVFESYFWNILNNGTRNVEIRLYPVTTVG